MAWQCTGKSLDELIQNLISNGLLKTPRVIEAFKYIDRSHYVTASRDSFIDSPSSIGFGATISAPHIHAEAIENLAPFLKVGARVLDVGCGSGYLEGIFHHLVAPSGKVIGLDHLSSLVELSRSNLLKSPSTAEALKSGSIQLLSADGRKGCPLEFLPEGGFDVIHVGASAPTLPEPLVQQLKRGGRMFIPIGETDQAVYQIDKDEEGKVTQTRLFGVRYILLTDAEVQDPYHK